MTFDPSPLLSNPLVYTIVAIILLVLALARKLDESPIIGWVRGAVSWAAQQRIEHEDASYRQILARLDRMEAHVETQRREILERDGRILEREDQLAQQFRYVAWLTTWARDVQLIIAAAVPPLTIPPFLSWSEWKEHDSTRNSTRAP